jgi:hypothetical protein
MTFRIHRLLVRLLIACVVLMASFAIARSQDNKTAAKAETERRENFALQFDAANGSIAATAPGAPINRTDNLRMEAVVRYDGPSADGGLLLYNGNGCCNGWGLVVYGTNAGSNAGRLAILAGGILFYDSQQSLTLPVGVWQRIRLESRGQLVTLSFPGNDPGPVFSFGIVFRNPLNFIPPNATPPSVTVGQGFNGLIADVRFTSLDTPNTVLESWRLNEGTGNVATGVNGAVLNLTNTSWVQLSRPDDNNDD